MKGNIEDYQILKFLQGECSPEEREKVLSWLSESEENRNTYFQLKAIWIAYKDNFSKDKKRVDEMLSLYRSQTSASKGLSGFFSGIYRQLAILFGSGHKLFSIRSNLKP